MRGQFFLRVEDQLTKIEKSEGNRKPPLDNHRNKPAGRTHGSVLA